MTHAPVPPDPWARLRALTPARIALGHAGVGMPTHAHLAFQMAHARARDAVHDALNGVVLADDLAGLGLPVVCAHSAVATRSEYLLRPDLGRVLDDASRSILASHVPADGAAPDAVFVVADGLSARAVQAHAGPLLRRVVSNLRQDGWTLGPAVIVEQGRVAVGDDVGEMLGARLVVVLIGERPGLTAPDSLGVYLTYGPRVGRTDAERNCISNVRPEGLLYDVAAHKLAWMMAEARRRRLSGVELKDEAPPLESADVSHLVGGASPEASQPTALGS